MREIALRFLIGGLFVSFFSVIADSLKPKTFSGLFSSAPSIALAGLILVCIDEGPQIAAVQAYSMIFGAVAMVIYSVSTMIALKNTALSPWVTAIALWIEWGIVAGALYQWMPKGRY